MNAVARWEWRTFGDSFGPAESHFATPERVEERDDLYLLSRNSDASVKVRDGRMDVKELQRVGDDGLEQWWPVLKAPYPLGAEDFGVLADALGVAVAPPADGAASLEDLAERLAGASPDLLAVMVHKRRGRLTIGGCMAELSEMRTELGATRTIAIESEDAARVTAAVRGLGLDARPNVNVARGLKTLAGFGARRYSVIDVGTNSVKFHIGERRADCQWQRIVDRAEVTRLGEGLEENGRLGAAPIERTVEAVAGMVDEA